MVPGEGTGDTKRRVSYQELLPDDPSRAEAVKRVVQRLANPEARLITTQGPGETGSDGSVEVAHEALIRGWRQLRKWIGDNREGIRTRRRLVEAAQEWAAAPNEAKDGFLYRDARLAVALAWAEGHRDELGKLESVFLAASHEAERLEKETAVLNERRLREAAEARELAEHQRAEEIEARRRAEAEQARQARLLEEHARDRATEAEAAAAGRPGSDIGS